MEPNEENLQDIQEESEKEYQRLVNNPHWFIEMIGLDGFVYIDDYPQDSPDLNEMDLSIISSLMEAYQKDDGEAFLKIIKSYAEEGFSAVAMSTAIRRKHQYSRGHKRAI